MVLVTQSVPTGVSLRMPDTPDTNKLPWLSLVMSEGLEKVAPVFVPSALPSTPAWPAMVVVTQLVPKAVILRIVELEESTT